jgi:cold shock CspA family protein
VGETILKGTVSFWSDRGFGFITPAYGDLLDVYVHASQLPVIPGKRNLTTGQAVEFEIDALEGKLFAKNVQVLGDTNARDIQK